MKEQEAIERCDLLINGGSISLATHRAFTDRCKGHPTFKTMKEFAETSKYALEKQIPKKVRYIHKAENGEDIEIYGSDALFGYCPNCNSFNCDVWNAENCGDCGQKLDWSDEE